MGPGLAINQQFWIWKKANVGPGTLETYESGAEAGGRNQYGLAVTLPGVGPGVKEFPGKDFTPGNFGLIDLGGEDGRPEPNALEDNLGLAQIGAGPDGTNGVELDPIRMTSGLSDQFTIALDNLDEEELFVGNIDWRNRGDSFIADQLSLPLIKVGEDLVKNNAGVIRVTLSDLPEGPYQVTSFHLDPDFTQCEAIDILVDVGDGNGYVDTGVIGNANLAAGGVGGLTPELLLQSAATFNFTADGTNDVMILFDGRFAEDTEVPLAGLNIQFGTVTQPGDYNDNGELDAGDLDPQAQAIAGGQNPTEFDLNGDGVVDFAGDRIAWLHDLKVTYVGDADLDGLFDSQDFVTVFVAGKYETGEQATWGEGDWNADLFFDTGDFVAAFVDGGYEAGAFPGAVQAVPEPSSIGLLLLGLLGLIRVVRRA